MMKILVIPILILTATSLAAQAQIVLEIEGQYSQEEFGETGIVPLSDVDGDGVSDFAVGGRRSSAGAIGHVAAYSGATGAELWDAIGTQQGIGYAHLVTGGGDVDGDGVWDVLVWAEFEGTGQAGWLGAVHVLSGATGAELRVHMGSGLGYGMQQPGVIFGDANGDGFDDYLIADNLGDDWSGEAYVISGRTGSALYTMSGTAARAQFFAWSTGLGDVDGDGLDDYATLDTESPFNRSISVHSGVTGQTIHTLLGSVGQGLRFGGPRCGGEDIDGDGFGDFVTAGFAGLQGLVQAVSGATGSVIWERSGVGGEGLGKSACVGDDWDGDGRADVMAYASFPPRWIMLSGANSSNLDVTLIPSPALYFGFDPYLFDDIDGDGSREVLSRGGRQNTWPVPPNDGSVFLTRHAGGPLSYRKEVGRACPASNGHLPRAILRQDPRLGTTAQVRLRGTTPGTAPVLVLGLPFPTGVQFEWVTGCSLLVNPVSAVALPPTDARGFSGADLLIPSVPAFSGMRLAFQWCVLDPAANASGVIGSTAMHMILGS